jgi:MarR family transcriptional regulator, temperature-dependent positive regulator of motility
VSRSDAVNYRSYWLRRTLQFHGHLWHQHVSPEISSIQFGLLTFLRGHPGIGQRELVALSQLDKSTLAELLKRMEQKGLVSTSRHTTDKRRKRVDLTEAGVETVRELDAKARAVNELLVAGLDEAEASELDRLLGKLLAGEQARAAAFS